MEYARNAYASAQNQQSAAAFQAEVPMPQPFTAVTSAQLKELDDRIDVTFQSLSALEGRLFSTGSDANGVGASPVPCGQVAEINQMLSHLISRAIDLSALARRLDSSI